ncbi:hypothetical protein AVEN_194839-1 [Araneus ventricosus]|uniref:Uncharacterized protein n=1 Tax=Araneus ventricosus TaxID=182803 RepID=A0A4Y2B693_ARAVE|nr:hypothetical protein AVEN_194839-1 [Araneus ventricosus]
MKQKIDLLLTSGNHGISSQRVNFMGYSEYTDDFLLRNYFVSPKVYVIVRFAQVATRQFYQLSVLKDDGRSVEGYCAYPSSRFQTGTSSAVFPREFHSPSSVL